MRLRRAGLELMDAADLLAEDRRPEAQELARKIIRELESVFWPAEAEGQEPEQSN